MCGRFIILIDLTGVSGDLHHSKKNKAIKYFQAQTKQFDKNQSRNAYFRIDRGILIHLLLKPIDARRLTAHRMCSLHYACASTSGVCPSLACSLIQQLRHSTCLWHDYTGSATLLSALHLSNRTLLIFLSSFMSPATTMLVHIRASFTW